MAKTTIAEQENLSSYPSSESFFSPSELYPEYPFADIDIGPNSDTVCVGGGSKNNSKSSNYIYSLVRRVLFEAGLDAAHYGTAQWNPMGEWIKPGQTVLLKPNWVDHKNNNPNVDDNLACLVTNPSVVRVVIDYVYIALKGNGRIIVADAPMQQCDLQQMFVTVGYDKLFDFYRNVVGVEIEVQDLRKYSIASISRGIFTAPSMTENSAGSFVVQLDSLSMHAENDNINPSYKVSEYRQEDTAYYHHDNKHAYEVSKTPLLADVIINIPKPKTHRLAGMTASIKNMVGITYEKSSLPHRKVGDAEHGGDTYKKKSIWKEWMHKFDEKKTSASLQRKYHKAWMDDKIMKMCYMLGWLTTGDKYRIGSWYGNDTIWRTAIDLNYLLLYADKEGKIKDTPQRKVITLADMVVCGQGAGPVSPHPKPLGMVMLADNSMLFDRVMCEIMGFDYHKIKMFNSDTALHKMGYESVDALNKETVIYNGQSFSVDSFPFQQKWAFDAHPCWIGNIEKR